MAARKWYFGHFTYFGLVFKTPKTKNAFPHLKERSNQKVEENKLALKDVAVVIWGGREGACGRREEATTVPQQKEEGDDFVKSD